VRVFDGVGEQRSGPTRVLVVGNLIQAIGPEVVAPAGGQVIDGGGRTLMPGLIDAHVHLAMAAIPLPVLLSADAGYIHAHTVKECERTLMRGFTTVRDAAGPVFGVKRAIDEGLIPGPRIYPSGAMISQTAGHGDFRLPYDVPKRPGQTRDEELGAGFVADGVDAVLKGSREQLLLGASQIKLAGGGGVSSNYDPLDVTQFTDDELRAAVVAADVWGTYVMLHAYTPKAIRRAVLAGVRCIEHGQLVDEETIQLIAEKGVWLCTQPFLNDGDRETELSPANQKKFLQMTDGTDLSIRLALKHRVQLAFGTDALFNARVSSQQGRMLGKMVRWMEPHQALRMATSINGQLMALSGLRNPYPGRLGVVQEQALADLLLVDGDPIEDIGLLAEPDKSLLVIMKDGKIFKNRLPADLPASSQKK
jgi:imidazolonepropionase-like amidohydrolase